MEYAKYGNIVDFVLVQLKRGYAGFAVIEGSNRTSGLTIHSLNSQFNHAVSRKPQFKKTIPQSGNRIINQDISILVNGPYIKLLFG